MNETRALKLHIARTNLPQHGLIPHSHAGMSPEEGNKGEPGVQTRRKPPL